MSAFRSTNFIVEYATQLFSETQLKPSLSLQSLPNQGLPFLANVVVLEVALGQCAIDAQSVSDCCDALGVVSACGHDVVSGFMKPDTTEAGV
jgi:hypothetical protein